MHIVDPLLALLELIFPWLLISERSLCQETLHMEVSAATASP
jgi:hypothetical protein